MKSNKMKVLFVSPESVPYATTGGLADVIESLPEALVKLDINVLKVMPKYKGIEDNYKLKKLFSFIVETGGRANVADIYIYEEHQVTIYFIGSTRYFERENLYGYLDDDERFGFFCKAVIEMILFLNIKLDIIHLNDWATGLIGLLLKEEYKDIDFYKNIKLIFTIHNLQYQGVFSRGTLEKLNLSSKYFNMESIEYYGKISYMKAGIIYADLVTTVSKTYAKEIQTPKYGYGLDGILRKYSNKLIGIVNGIHYDKFNPETDTHLWDRYNIENAYEKKKDNKYKLKALLGLPNKDMPLIGMISRLTEQKGIDITIEAIEKLMNENVLVVILGTGDKQYEDQLRELSRKYNDKVKVLIEFDQDIARKIYAASDILLMPSLFEPCGLAQLYSLRFGTVPIVRNTGGFVDTIEQFDLNSGIGTGIIFDDYSGEALVEAIIKALKFYNDEKTWKLIMHNAMSQRFSWDKAAIKYLDEYQKILD